MTERTITWRELLAETTALVGDATHARWICETATSTTPIEFGTMLDVEATERTVAHLDSMVVRARAGEPIQYVLGSWGFRRLDLAVDARVLIPRPETELVAGRAIELGGLAGPTRRVADLGTGSGAIGLSMAVELPYTGTEVWITDVSADALALARDNLAGIGRAATNVRIASGSWCAALPDDVLFDVIVSNPPYVSESSDEVDAIVTEWEPADALFAGPDGLDDLRTLVAAAPSRLVPGGWLVLEHGYDQGGAVRDLMRAADMVEVETSCDLAGLDRYTVGRRQ
jgi:release factor glutamine methyltransferase